MKMKTHNNQHHTNRNRNRNNKDNNNCNRVSGIIQNIIFCCQGRHLHSQLLPFVSAFVACFLVLFSLVSFLSPPINHHRVHRVYNNHSLLDDEIDFRSHIGNTSTFLVPRAGGSLGDHIWTSSQSQIHYGCSKKSETFQDADNRTKPDRFMMIVTSGGLNQQRTGITDAVVAAYILNCTLVVPKLDNRSYWQDQSNFSDIFDVDWFMSYLTKDINIIKELPTVDGKYLHPYRTRVPRKCDLDCYESRVLPLIEKNKVVLLTKFDYRLSKDLPIDLQKLRCRANYHALRYTESISEMGKKLVERMRMKSEHYIALHLRYESDMLAFSGCYFGGGDKERRELEQIRTRWETLPKRNPDKERMQGRCPLTPEEVGLLLRALGYGEDVHIYVASGAIYGGKNALFPLKHLFPNLHSKYTLTTQEELAPFALYSSRMAALDFIVCNKSDVFVTNNNGNMAKMLAGGRKYFGYKPTIRPNAKKLCHLFSNRGNMTWDEFSSRVRTHQIGFMGRPNESKPEKGEFHENPAACICVDSSNRSLNQSQSKSKKQSPRQTQDQNETNKNDKNESKAILTDELTREEKKSSLTQHTGSQNATRVQELPRRNINDSAYCDLEVYPT